MTCTKGKRKKKTIRWTGNVTRVNKYAQPYNGAEQPVLLSVLSHRVSVRISSSCGFLMLRTLVWADSSAGSASDSSVSALRWQTPRRTHSQSRGTTSAEQRFRLLDVLVSNSGRGVIASTS